MMIKQTSLVALMLAPLILLGCPDTRQAYEIPDASPAVRDAGPEDAPVVDVMDDAGSDAFDPACDSDEDGYLDESCGGSDCDDDSFAVNPGADEKCSYADEDCDGDNNEGLDCTFVASSGTTLYAVNPFERTLAPIATVRLPDPNHGLLDIDIDDQGRLLGVTQDGLYLIDANGDMTELQQVSLPAGTNGMAIDSSGTIFVTNKPPNDQTDATASTIDSLTGDLSVLGDLTPYVSSGDCVTLKDDSLLMTAPDPNTPYDPQNPLARKDVLVRVNSATAQTSAIGDTGYAKIYGLSASFNFLFGVTDSGKVLRIDPNTGQAELIFEDSSKRFWGAANGD